jgi:cytosine/adenosine deaminase-related metal-dependent hydrolase
VPDGRDDIDIAARDGRIVAIEPNIQAEAGTIIDARGRLVSPPFVDCHFHMDATLSLGLPRLNQSGTLLEGIALWGELKPLLTHEAVAERALRYCDLAVSQGLLAGRSHVDVCDDRLVAVEALIDVRERRSLISICNSPLSRRTAISAPRTGRAISSARSTWGSKSSAAFRTSSARWRRARLRSRRCAKSPPGGGS